MGLRSLSFLGIGRSFVDIYTPKAAEKLAPGYCFSLCYLVFRVYAPLIELPLHSVLSILCHLCPYNHRNGGLSMIAGFIW